MRLKLADWLTASVAGAESVSERDKLSGARVTESVAGAESLTERVLLACRTIESVAGAESEHDRLTTNPRVI